MIPPQIFIVHSQAQLLEKSFNPTQEDLQFGKNSLIQKYKISNGTQQLLFCKKIHDGQQEFMSINQKNIIQNERKKYIDFIRRNYNEKISQELFNMNKLKNRIKQFQAKQLQEKHRQDELNSGKKVTRVTEAQKRKAEDKNVTAGKKKLKTEKVNQVVAPKGKKNQSKKQPQKPLKPPQQAKQAEEVEQIEQDPSQSESLDLNLMNSLSQEYNNDQE